MAVSGDELLTFVCIASGPSLHPDDVDYCRGKATVICINDAYRVAPWGDYLYAADYHWWEHHIENVRSTFQGECYGLQGAATVQYGLHAVPDKAWPGLGTECIHCGNYWAFGKDGRAYMESGQNGGYQAVNLAYLLGAERVVLLGYDMQANGKTHWFGDHPKELHRESPYPKFVRAFEAMAQHEHGLEVVNCSRETALTCFPRADVRDVL